MLRRPSQGLSLAYHNDMRAAVLMWRIHSVQTGHPDIEQLSAWLEGDLEPATHASLQAHVAGCAHCQAEVEGLREFLSAMQQLPELEAPAGFTQRVMDRVEQAERRTFRYWMAKLKLPTLLVPVTVAALALFMIRQPEQEALEVESIRRWEQAGSDALQEAEAVPVGEAAASAPSAPAPSEPLMGDIMDKARAPAAAAPADVGGVAQGGGAPSRALDRAPGAAQEAPMPSVPDMRGAERLAARLPSGPVPAELPALERMERTKSDGVAPERAGFSVADAPAPPPVPAPSAGASALSKNVPAGGRVSLEGEALPPTVLARRAEKPVAQPAEVATEAPKLEMARELRTQGDAPKRAREEADAQSVIPLGSAGALVGEKGVGGSAGYGSGAGLGAAPERKRADEPAKTTATPAAAMTTGGMASSEISAETGKDKTASSAGNRAPASAPAQAVTATRTPASTSVRDVLAAGRSKKSQTLAEAIEAQAPSPVDSSDDRGAEEKDEASTPPFWQDQRPPDAVVVVQDRAGLDEQLSRIVRLLKAQRSPLQRLENNRRRVILQLKPDQYPLLIQQLDRHSDFGATPPPGKPTTQRVWVEIVPVVP